MTEAAILAVVVSADTAKAIGGLKSADAQFKKTGASAVAMDKAITASNSTARNAAVGYSMLGSNAASSAKGADKSAAAQKKAAGASRQVAKDAAAARGAATGLGAGMSVAQGGAFALAYGLGTSIKAAADFDSEMRNVNSIARLSETQFQSLKGRVLGLAGPTAQAPSTLAKGMYQLVSSGFDAEGAVRVLSSSAIAASAGLTDAETATTAIAGALNAYQLKAKDAQMVSDLLFTTVDKGVMSFGDLAQGLGPVLPFASKLGVDLKQVGAMLSILTIKGVPAAEAMTYTKGAMAQMVKPTKDLKKEFKDLGVASGQELVSKTGSLQSALEALYQSVGRDDQKFAKLFPDIRGMTAAFTVTGKGANEAARMLDEFNVKAGRTNEVFKEQSKGQGFTWKQLGADIQQAAVNIGNGFAPEAKKAGNLLHTVFQAAHKNRNTIGEVFDSVKVGSIARFAGPLGQIASQVRDINKLTGIKGSLFGSGGADPFKGLTNRGATIKVDNGDAKKKIIDTSKGLGAIPGLVTTKVKIETDSDVMEELTRIKTQLTSRAIPIKIKTEFDRGGNASTVVSPSKIKPVKIPVEKPKPFKLTVDNSQVKPKVSATKSSIDLLPFKKQTKITTTGAASAIGQASSVASAINAIPSSKTTTVYVKNVGGSGKRRAGGGRVGRNEPLTEVNEHGPEAARYPDGSFGMLGSGRRAVMSLAPGTEVFTAPQTRGMLAALGIEGMSGGGSKGKKKLAEKRRKARDRRQRIIDRNNDRINSRSRVQDLKDQTGAVNLDDAGQATSDLGTAYRHRREAKNIRGKGRREALAQADLEIAQAKKRQADAQQDELVAAMQAQTEATKAHTQATEDLSKEMKRASDNADKSKTVSGNVALKALTDLFSGQIGSVAGNALTTSSPIARGYVRV